MYSVFGGIALVGAKALLIFLLAIVLMRLSGTERFWLAAVCSGLALLALSTRLTLQPAIVSYLLWVMTFVALRKGSRSDTAGAAGVIAFWPLAPLFLVWANADGWFQLGLLATACFFLGRLVDLAAQDRIRLAHLFSSALGLAILSAVCLANPITWRVFFLIPELTWSADVDRDALAVVPIRSPFSWEYWDAFGRSPAGLAYYPLLGLGFLSFCLKGARWRWRWFLPWLALALLSAWQVRVVPFFALWTAPVMAWNFESFLASAPADLAGPTGRYWSVGRIALRGFAALLGVAFLVCAWPGWLQLPPYEPRRWAVEFSPSLVRAAQAQERWLEQGKLAPETHGLHLSRQSAQIFAWYCPQAKGLWDPELAAVFFAPSQPPADLHRRLQSAGIHHVIAHDNDPSRQFFALSRCWVDPKQWPMIYLEGNVVMFGWRDPSKAAPADKFVEWELDLPQRALRPAAEKQAPAVQPVRASATRPWSDVFWRSSPVFSLDRDEATVYVLLAEFQRLTAPVRHLQAWEASQAAALTAGAPGWTGATCAVVATAGMEQLQPHIGRDAVKKSLLPGMSKWVLEAQRNFTWERDDSPCETLYQALRAARRASAQNPHDARTHYILGNCYLRLLHHTRERAWSRRLSELLRLRQAQASEALNRAVALDPQMIQAHDDLAALYGQMAYWDLAVKHGSIGAELAQAKDAIAEKDREKELEWRPKQPRQWAQSAEMLHEAEKWHDDQATGVRVLDRARLAMQKGLAGKARRILEESDIAAFGPQGMALELDLFLRTGRARDVPNWTNPEIEAALGVGSYRWMRAQAFAATGDYELADAELAKLAAGDAAINPREAIAVLVGQHAALEGRLGAGSLPELIRRVLVRTVFLDSVGAWAQSLRRSADVTVLRGLLALEQGRADDARAFFRQALAMWHPTGAGGSIDFDARGIAQAWNDQLR